MTTTDNVASRYIIIIRDYLYGARKLPTRVCEKSEGNKQQTHTHRKKEKRAIKDCGSLWLSLVVIIQFLPWSYYCSNGAKVMKCKAKASVRDGSLNLFLKKLIFSCRQPPTLQKKKKNKRPSQQHNKPDIGVCVIVH